VHEPIEKQPLRVIAAVGGDYVSAASDGREYGSNPRTSKEAKHIVNLIRYETAVSICDVMPRKRILRNLLDQWIHIQDILDTY